MQMNCVGRIDLRNERELQLLISQRRVPIHPELNMPATWQKQKDTESSEFFDFKAIDEIDEDAIIYIERIRTSRTYSDSTLHSNANLNVTIHVTIRLT